MSHEHTQSLKVAGSGRSWHGWETDISLEDSHNLHKVMQASGLENVRSIPLVAMEVTGDGENIDTKMFETGLIGLYDSRGICLGSHGADSYQIHQPEETLQPYWDIIESMGGFRFDFLARLRGGKVWVANFVLEEGENIVSERHDVYLGISSSFDGTRATTADASTIRKVCMNTVNLSDCMASTVKTRFRHRRALPSSDVFRRQIENALAQKEQYKKFAELLAQYRVSKDKAKDMLSSLLFTPKLEKVELANGETGEAWTTPSTRTANRIDTLIKSYETTLDELGNEGSGWALLNTVTRFFDHETTPRMTEDRKESGATVEQVKYENNLYGSANASKNEAIAKIKEFCEIKDDMLIAA